MPDGVVLGFDFGTEWIGVALGNRIAGSARPLTAVGGGDPPAWPAIDELIAEWRPARLVVGLPLDDQSDEPGAEQPMTRRSRRFMRQLAARFEIAVDAVDERYTTTEAVDRLRAARASGSRKTRVTKTDRDAAAAGVIVETWLAQTEPSATV
ncbi:Holliday junction resolvase RuvX [Salinisphaera orenii]|uniref:Holliday junction resolvase RuvX n=1 Tax=Salinisphaera orenii TaxID=856731 RepID=UPI00296F478F